MPRTDTPPGLPAQLAARNGDAYCRSPRRLPRRPLPPPPGPMPSPPPTVRRVARAERAAGRRAGKPGLPVRLAIRKAASPRGSTLSTCSPSCRNSRGASRHPTRAGVVHSELVGLVRVVVPGVPERRVLLRSACMARMGHFRPRMTVPCHDTVIFAHRARLTPPCMSCESPRPDPHQIGPCASDEVVSHARITR